MNEQKKTMNIIIRKMDTDIIAAMDMRARQQGIKRQELLKSILTKEFLDDLQVLYTARLQMKPHG